MTLAPQPVGRRERNKQQKLERITAAASELFAEHGIEDVTTQQIADKADIGTGTLFLYAKTKGELLLLVQNAHYAEALAAGPGGCRDYPGCPRCGDGHRPADRGMQPHPGRQRAHLPAGDGLRRPRRSPDTAKPSPSSSRPRRPSLPSWAGTSWSALVMPQPRHTSSPPIMFLSMAASVNAALSIDEIVRDIRAQVGVLLSR